ncbi:MAG: AAA family ATPase [Candidatus Sifarchaeia archaeon]|jgi:MoxR-like ATPase
MNINVNSVYDEVCAQIVGRRKETRLILSSLAADKAVLLEGAPGTSKTTILRALSDVMKVPFYFVEGNEDLTVPKLIGHFDPSAVLQTGYLPENFRKGPLAKAMEAGGILYIEEINRAPPETLNVLLVSLSEKTMDIPRYGNIKANANFSVVATQNPLDDIGVSRISRGVLDRFVSLRMVYQPKEEELLITKNNTQSEDDWLIDLAVEIVRRSRKHPELKAGASVRGAIDLVQLIQNDPSKAENYTFEDLLDAAIVSLRLKIWPSPTTDKTEEEIIYEIISSIFEELQSEIDPERPGKGEEQKEEEEETENEEDLEKDLFPETKEESSEEEEDEDIQEVNVSMPDEIEGDSYALPLDKGTGIESYSESLRKDIPETLISFDTHPTYDSVEGFAFHKRSPREYMKQLAKILSMQIAIKRALRATPFGRREGRLRPHKFDGVNELDIDRTIESLVEEIYPTEEDFFVRCREKTSRGAILLVDSSESMRGEKIEIATLIASVLSYAMNRKNDSFGVIAYNNSMYLLKGLNQQKQIDEVVTDIISLRHTMLTNIRGALELALSEFVRANTPKKVAFLISDCVWTYGNDPRDVIKFFDQVNVFYIPPGRPWFAEQLAKNGRVLEINRWQDVVVNINDMLAAAF